MGGAATLLALSRGLTVQAAVISSAFARVEAITDYVLRRWFLPPSLFGWVVSRVWSRELGAPLKDLEPEVAIRSVRVPVLLAHGTHDPLIPDREVRRLEAAAPPGAARLLMVAGAAHSNLTEDPGYRQALEGFLAEHLDPCGRSPGEPPGIEAGAARDAPCV
jgi:pimeloyl-ACP methyl ester carboxylesterase